MAARKSTKRQAPPERSTRTRSRTLAKLSIPPSGPIRLDLPHPKSLASLTVAAGATPGAQTVIYVHGIGNKPPASVLKCQWDSALFGTQLGDRSRMAYWVNRECYPLLSNDTCNSGDTARIDDDEITTRSIMALDFIADLNEHAGKLVIQGVNLSLGGSFDPSIYGCGHTPMCQELRRLWGQGVLVCLAAGNEGYAMLQGEENTMAANMDLSIGDPANLEEAIAVGSVHKSNPHTYGIFYFSSRGPTADGRRKPDLVAPGEQILSAYHNWNRRKAEKNRLMDDLYVELSGTSMAALHVSGILSAFLSMRREFIGYPDRVKSIVLENCTDLGRDPYIQGYGMPNLIRMLGNV